MQALATTVEEVPLPELLLLQGMYAWSISNKAMSIFRLTIQSASHAILGIDHLFGL